MSFTLNHWNKFVDVALLGDFIAVRNLVEQGFDINLIHPISGDTVITAYCSEIYLKESENPFIVSQYKYAMLEVLIDLGADVSLGDESPIVQPIWYCDKPMIELLAKAGIDMNAVSGRTEHETLYDTAKYAYLRAVNLPNTGIKMLLDDLRYTSEDEWLECILTMAVEARTFILPDHLVLMRRYGAKSFNEIKNLTRS
jgi:hypothetical protein